MKKMMRTVGLSMLILSGMSWAEPGDIEAIGYNAAGDVANGIIQYPVTSADGRWVAFRSRATNLVANDTNLSDDIFLLDRSNDSIVRVSLDSLGNQNTVNSDWPTISADGEIVVFATEGKLLPQDTNSVSDIYAWHRSSGSLSLVSSAADGTVGNGASNDAAISADGKWVAFQSLSTNFESPGSVNNGGNQGDIYLKNLQDGSIHWISRPETNGLQSNGVSVYPYVSADGRLVAFSSRASNLVSADSNNDWDVFVRDWQNNKNYLVSAATTGGSANGASELQGFSADGNLVLFSSLANNLIASDTNGEVDLFLRDLKAGTTEIISLNWSGNQVTHSVPVSYSRSSQVFSADGRFFVFNTNSGLSFIDSVDYSVYVYDRLLHKHQRYSVDASGLRDGGAADYFSPAISADGHYLYFVGADKLVPSAPGNRLYVANLATKPPYVYCSPRAWDGLVVPDNDTNGAEDTINISEAVNSWEMAVKLRISHAYMSDLQAKISHSSLGATPRALFTNPSCSYPDMNATLWTQVPGIDVNSAGACNSSFIPAISGWYSPETDLSYFLSPQNVQGTWTLRMEDTIAQDSGRVQQWCLLPLSHGECDAADISQQNRTVNSGEHLVCNAGYYASTGGVVENTGSLSVNFSGHAGFSQLDVKTGGVLRLNAHNSP